MPAASWGTRPDRVTIRHIKRAGKPVKRNKFCFRGWLKRGQNEVYQVPTPQVIFEALHPWKRIEIYHPGRVSYEPLLQ